MSWFDRLVAPFALALTSYTLNSPFTSNSTAVRVTFSNSSTLLTYLNEVDSLNVSTRPFL